jgi:hypothetical protein
VNATVVHPFFGTVYLYEAFIRDGYIIGDAGEKMWLTDQWVTVPCTMNFPLSCVKELDGAPWPFKKTA